MELARACGALSPDVGTISVLEIMIVNWKLIRASAPEDFTRPYVGRFPLKTDKAVPMGDIGTLRSHVFYLFQNLGPLRVAIQEKAMYAVGSNHWLPIFVGNDEAYKSEVEQWLILQWYPICNVLGEEYDFQTTLYLLSVNLDVWGEFFLYLTESEDSEPGAGDGGYPMIQIVWVYQIDQPRATGALDNANRLTGNAFGGKFRGLKVEMGVVKSAQGRAVAYSVLMDDPANDDLISANDMIRVRELNLGDETRATPTAAHGIDQGRSMLSLLSNEQDFLENASRVNLLEYNDLAGLDPNDPQSMYSGLATPPGDTIVPPNQPPNGTSSPINGMRTTAQEWMQRAQTRYYNPQKGNKLEAFQFNRPAQEWSEFMDKLSRFLIDPIWPFYLVDREGEIGGATVRSVLARANRIIQDRQQLIRRVARRCVQYAVAKATKTGRLPKNEQWWMFNFTVPARITVDYGRDSKSDVLEIQAGTLDPAQVVEARGEEWQTFNTQKYRNQAAAIKIKQRVEQETGIQLPDQPPPVLGGSSKGGGGDSGFPDSGDGESDNPPNQPNE